MAKDAEARSDLVTKYKSMGTPTIVIDDKKIIQGFQKQKLAEALGIK